ncbi:hypothetical protein B0H14DRAFT_3128375 [Mycena olivaceomarginata]|nr:hypothetical protein B0H14DRAFT_3128375 [Mycena olivaceomarginata]
MSNQSHQTPSTLSIFDNDEQDDRQSLSSADVSTGGALEDATREKTPLPRARAAIQLYATPQARSVTSSIAAPAKAKLEKVSPGGRIKADQHRSFDNKGFVLLPTNADLCLFTPSRSRRIRRTSKRIKRKTFEYRIVPLQLSRDGNAVFRRQGPEYKKIFPLADPTTLPTVQSDVNPFFVIANTGPKLGPGMDLVPDDMKRTPAIYVDLFLLGSLWATWSSRTPPQMWREAKYMHRGGGGNEEMVRATMAEMQSDSCLIWIDASLFEIGWTENQCIRMKINVQRVNP